MAVPEQTPYKEYVGNGVTTNFALEFTCDSKQELKVFIDNVEPELSTWSLVGGGVVFTTAPASGSKIVLKRATKLERTTNYSSTNNSFRPEAINKDLDRIWYAIQEQNYKVGQYDYDYNFVLSQVRPIATGGTGANNPNDARNNLNTYSKEEVNALIATGGESNVVGVSGGGTGATTAAGARTNLNVMSSAEVAAAINTATPPASTTTQGLIQIATQAEVNAAANSTKAVVPNNLLGGMKTHLSASGFAPLFACRAWVNFDGTGTPSIRASGNVSSITDNGVGDYTINFSTSMPDTKYSIATSSTEANDLTPICVSTKMTGTTPTLKATNAVRISARSPFSAGALDISEINLQVFR